MAPVLQNGYHPPVNTLFHGVITTTGGVTGTFSTLANPFISPILFLQPIYTPTTFDLLVKGNFANSALDLTHNQFNVGAMLNGLQTTATGDLANVLNTIAYLPAGAVGNAYQQISPDKAAALPTLAFAGANLQKRILAERITNLRFGGQGPAAWGACPAPSTSMAPGPVGMMLAFNSSNLSGLITSDKRSEPAAPQSRWGLYLDPALILGSQQSSENQTGFNFTIAGFNAGVDYRVRDDLLVGLATGYTHTGAGF